MSFNAINRSILLTLLLLSCLSVSAKPSRLAW